MRGSVSLCANLVLSLYLSASLSSSHFLSLSRPLSLSLRLHFLSFFISLSLSFCLCLSLLSGNRRGAVLHKSDCWVAACSLSLSLFLCLALPTSLSLSLSLPLYFCHGYYRGGSALACTLGCLIAGSISLSLSLSLSLFVLSAMGPHVSSLGKAPFRAPPCPYLVLLVCSLSVLFLCAGPPCLLIRVVQQAATHYNCTPSTGSSSLKHR